jgi:hypothetical protein
MAGRADELEARAQELAGRLAAEFADLGPDARWLIARALIHRGVHFAVDQDGKKGVEYCTVASYLGEMVGHAHKLAHGENPKSAAHRDLVH